MEFSAGKARPLLENWEFGFDFAILLRKKKPKIILVFSYFFRFRWFGRLSSLQGTFNIRAHIVDCVYRLVAVCMLRARGLFFLIFLQWEDLICYLMWQRNANLNHICIMKSPVVGDAIVPLYYCCCCCPRTTHTEQQQVKENGWNDTHKKMRKRSRVDAYSCVRELRKFSYLLVVDMPFFNFFFFFFFLAFFVHSFAYFRCCCCMWYSFIRRVCELRFWFFSITNEKKKKLPIFFCARCFTSSVHFFLLPPIILFAFSIPLYLLSANVWISGWALEVCMAVPHIKSIKCIMGTMCLCLYSTVSSAPIFAGTYATRAHNSSSGSGGGRRRRGKNRTLSFFCSLPVRI